MNDDLIRRVAGEAGRFFDGVPGSHDWSHTERVVRLALHIARVEGGDPEIVHLAALLHDTGRAEQDRTRGATCHAELGARIARRVLSRIGYPPGRTERVARCIERHRFRGRKAPAAVEEKILFDADKLDSIGAVGVGRAFLFAGEVGATLHNSHVDPARSRPYTRQDTAYREFVVKLRHVRERMLTGEGRRMAASRHAFMESFFDRLEKEVRGEA